MEVQEESSKVEDAINVDSDDQQPPVLDPADGNFVSRKFIFAVGTAGLIFIGGILAGVWKLFDSHYESMIQGLLACLGLYLGSNVSSRYVTGKHLAAMSNPTPTSSNRRQ